MNNVGSKKCAEHRDDCINEAIEILSHYRADPNPFLDDFLTKFELDKPKTVKAKLELIKDSVLEQKASCEYLLEYIDGLKMWGKQHIFLFSLKKEEKDYLEKLVEPGYIENRLKELGLKACYNNNICIYKTEKPFLAELLNPPVQDGVDRRLIFKWIETRQYEKKIKKTIVIKEERSVNFFLVNLENGNAELRLQILQPNPFKKLEDEYAIYIEEIKKLIEFHHFSPVLLEPVMRTFFFKAILPITEWSIKTQQGALGGRKANPTFFRKLGLYFKNFSLHKLTLYWECEQIAQGKGKLYFYMHVDNNMITFNAITDKWKVDFILDKIFPKLSKKIEISNGNDGTDPLRSPNGIIDAITKNIKNKRRRRIVKKMLQLASLPAISITIRMIFRKILKELAKIGLEKLLRIPLFSLEILIYIVLMVGLYGGKRIKKYFYKIPRKWANKVILSVIGKTSSIIINSKEYYDWMGGKSVDYKSLSKTGKSQVQVYFDPKQGNKNTIQTDGQT